MIELHCLRVLQIHLASLSSEYDSYVHYACSRFILVVNTESKWSNYENTGGRYINRSICNESCTASLEINHNKGIL